MWRNEKCNINEMKMWKINEENIIIIWKII